MDEKKYFLGLFVDLSKVLDTVNHKILINKLENCVICGKNLLWFKSYLSNRKQNLEYKDDFNEQKTTNLLEIKCGVPQGSFYHQSCLQMIPIYFILTVILKFCLKMQTMNWKKIENGLRLIKFH